MAKFEVKVIPKSRKQAVKFEANLLKVHLHSAPEGGKANDELVLILADFFDVPKSSITIVRGLTSKNKLVDIVGISPNWANPPSP